MTTRPSLPDLPAHVRGLIFDCDGTIADTMPLHYQAWVAALNEHGADFPEAFFYEMAGVPTARIIEILNEKHGYGMNVPVVAEHKERLYLELIPQVVPIEPVVQCIQRYAGTMPMAVATGATRAICEKTLGAMGLLGEFKAIVTADDVRHGKPAPDIFLESARRLGVEPTACCVFEDGEPGIGGARAANMHVIDVRPLYLPR